MAHTIILSRETAFEISSLVYYAWTVAYDANKKVAAETNDGSPDWSAFHVTRVENAKKRLATTKKTMDDFLEQLPKDFLTSAS